MNRRITLLVIFSILLGGCSPNNSEREISSTNEITNNKILVLEDKIIKQEDLITHLSEEIVEQQNEIDEINQSINDRLKLNEKDMNMVLNQFFERNKTEVELNIVKNFIKSLPEYEETYGWIREYSDKNKKVKFDNLEWVSIESAKRINELQLDSDSDFPNGFHLYNEIEKVEEFLVDDSIMIYDLVEIGSLLSINGKEFEEQLAGNKPFCKVIMHKRKVIAILETYLP